MCLLSDLLGLREGITVVRFLSVLTTLLHFEFCNCGYPPIQHRVITMLEQGPAPQLRDLVMKGERVRLEGGDHRKAYHY